MRKRTVFLALILVAIGSYLLLRQLNVGVPGFDRIWPVFPFAGGVTLLVNYITRQRRDHMLVFWGTAFALTGLFFFLITLGAQDYTILNTWWPVFIVISGIAFLVLWLAQGLRDWGAFFLAIVGLILGGVALAVNMQVLGPNTTHDLSRLWPTLLIFVGLLLLLRELLARRKSD